MTKKSSFPTSLITHPEKAKNSKKSASSKRRGGNSAESSRVGIGWMRSLGLYFWRGWCKFWTYHWKEFVESGKNGGGY